MKRKKLAIQMEPSHPGNFIREEIIEPLQITVTHAAKILGVRRASLSDLLHQKKSLSPEMALRIEKAFDVSMDLMLNMQAMHDSFRMRKQSDRINVDRFQK